MKRIIPKIKIIEVKRAVPAKPGMFVADVQMLINISCIETELFTNINTILKTTTPEINNKTSIIRFILWIIIDLFFPKSMI